MKRFVIIPLQMTLVGNNNLGFPRPHPSTETEFLNILFFSAFSDLKHKRPTRTANAVYQNTRVGADCIVNYHTSM